MKELDFNYIAKFCYDFYDKNIFIKSRPTASEWTNMAAILIEIDESNFKVLSMATGSKCLSEKQLPLNGTLVHDSHAEILARRCFLRFVYHEMLQLTSLNSYESEIFDFKGNKFSVKEGIRFILFTSHTPCGDASIIPMQSGNKRSLNENIECVKRLKTEDQIFEDIHRTGAKCVPNSINKDLREKGIEYHVTGVMRTKPGRGDPTISMSCSDKIAKWLVLGIQGSLLSNLFEKPIYLSAIVIGKCPYSYDSIERALIKRSEEYKCQNDFKLTIPIIGQSNLCFKESKLIKIPEYVETEKNPDFKTCPISVCWSYGFNEKPLFVLVKGFLQGTAIKSQKKNSNYPPICKFSFFLNFEKIYSKLNSKSFKGKTYLEAKKIPNEYNKAKGEFLKVYADWIRTNEEKYYKFIL